MKYKDYSADIWKRINTTLDLILKEDSAPVAAFDADGTLWDTDLGETFFHHQIDNKLVTLPPEPWEHYQSMKAENPAKAYLWLAQICQGQKLEQIHSWAIDAVKGHFPLPVFTEQKKLIDLFLSKGVRIYVVTASVKWAVEPGAEMLGLKKEDVIGIETVVENGTITSSQKGLITYKQGKVDALLEKTGGKKPFFASGNTMGDYQLLQSATHLGLAVSAAARDDRLFKTEQELQENAEKFSWLSHRFI
ncbi:haloacid dehalogenase-like hydrolase [Bdellovibrio bacteriovorus]|uniref:HAD family hydrolase n=1 Tax=Bdellovibrio bacteriovorus TaxID=959 RepID=UPI0021D36F4B|nr:haloacid dehalogenase-like hydrolase [Bdellovibrio bacteriovorus]UXR65563.1 haloacid dehalogenase-like hydrolase [Bdellovibrio bacteriovorus]